jgi:type IV secretory pathway VirB3-like protein
MAVMAVVVLAVVVLAMVVMAVIAVLVVLVVLVLVLLWAQLLFLVKARTTCLSLLRVKRKRRSDSVLPTKVTSLGKEKRREEKRGRETT